MVEQEGKQPRTEKKIRDLVDSLEDLLTRSRRVAKRTPKTPAHKEDRHTIAETRQEIRQVRRELLKELSPPTTP